MGNQKQRMLTGELYQADDPSLAADYLRGMALMERFNATPAADPVDRRATLKELLSRIGEGSEIRPPLYCDDGMYITIGRGTFVNFGTDLLDVAPISPGDDVQVSPSVQFRSATHPLDPSPRPDKRELAKLISVGGNVWIGGGAIILPGVSIGENSVIGAGTVVTNDIPANVAAGNPARVIREF